ncbi:histidine phosphatase family protein [Spirulina sp. CS-785/01]|uniref:histidine phosphatase family protein n=1 Tax=Spirulina sp. CS-785/01 TaxID=3021716 RepID=UPI0023315172|nr:histidine phosphatase family protein [Spirulina sp. CS-785/01]MDB9312506.1 histidine phosphatase family protein [Spirulina sp. CS-785/01]
MTDSPQQTLWIARHGNREDFVDPSWISTAGHPFNPALSEDGIQQAKDLAQRLAQEDIAHIFTSPFLRTVQTADFVADKLNLPLKLETGLSEWLTLYWICVNPDLLPKATLKKQFPAIDTSYQPLVPANYPETTRMIRQRLRDTLNALLERYSENLLLVTHSSAIVYMTKYLAPDAPSFKCPVCGVVKLTRRGQTWTVERAGDTSHLSQPIDPLTLSKSLWRKFYMFQRLLLK